MCSSSTITTTASTQMRISGISQKTATASVLDKEILESSSRYGTTQYYLLLTYVADDEVITVTKEVTANIFDVGDSVPIRYMGDDPYWIYIPVNNGWTVAGFFMYPVTIMYPLFFFIFGAFTWLGVRKFKEQKVRREKIVAR